MRFRWLLCFTLLTLNGCESAYLGPERATTDSMFVLGVGRLVMVAEERLSIGFESVLEDSRCPIGAFCVWEGNARILVRIGKRGNHDTTAQISTFLAPREVVYLNYMVRLVALEPVPVEGVPTDTTTYKATLAVRRTQR